MKARVTSTRHAPGTILGSYRLGEVIGEGSMGIVYVATHVRIDRRVAIKVLRSEYATNREAHQRFFDEARAVNKIEHRNVIEVTDFVEKPGEDNYFVMELLEGSNLGELIAAGGVLQLPRTVAIMTQLASALDAVHRAGIIHCDVKPFNVILIDRGGNQDFVKLVDFGVAHLFGEAGGMSLDRSADRGIVGTPRYMSPEQASGREVDHRSDVYSFGAVLYELVTGRAPLQGADFGDLVGKLRAVVPTPPSEVAGLPHEVPRALDELITRCLAKDPGERPARMEIVADKLLAIGRDHGWFPEPSLVTPLSPPTAEPAPPPVRRRGPWVLAGVVVLALAGIGVGIFVARSGQPAGQAAPDPAAERRAQIDAAIAIADQRIGEGRFVGPGGDEALDHLLAARAIEPAHAGVCQRLDAMARKFEGLANDAAAADSLAEAAAHLQTVLSIEPDNAAAAARMEELEQQVLARQRARRPNKKP